MSSVKYKLNGKQRILVCTLLASGYNPPRVVKEIQARCGVTVTRENIYSNYVRSAKWQKIIQRISKRIEGELLTHPLYCKTKRLNIILEAINEAMGENKQLSALATLIQAAKNEVEGNKPVISVSANIVIQQLHTLASPNDKKETNARTDESGIILERGLRVIT